MKKLILFVLLMSIITKHYAQIEKGTTLPGISLQGMYSKSNNKNPYYYSGMYSNTIQYNFLAGLNFRYGKFVKDNLLVTGLAGYTSNYWKSTNDMAYGNNHNTYTDETRSNICTIQIGVSKYKLIKDNFYINFGPVFSVSYSEGNDVREYFQSSYDTLNGYEYLSTHETNFSNSLSGSLYFNIGINYFVAKNFALTASIGAFSANYTVYPYFNEQNKTNQNSFDVRLLASYNAFSAGLVFFIRPKKDK